MILLFIYLISLVNTLTYQKTYDVWGDGTYKFTWLVNTDTKMISFNIQANTSGWAGFGIALNGFYQGVNHFIGYADTQNRIHLGEYYTDNSIWDLKPVQQLGGSVTLVGAKGSYKDGILNYRFSRKLDIGNNRYAANIGKGETIYMTFTWRDVGDPSTEGGKLLQHTKSAFMRLVLYPDSIDVPLSHSGNRRSSIGSRHRLVRAGTTTLLTKGQ
jgi:hypothetical protein